MPVPLGSDQRGHRYRPIASLTLLNRLIMVVLMSDTP